MFCCLSSNSLWTYRKSMGLKVCFKWRRSSGLGIAFLKLWVAKILLEIISVSWADCGQRRGSFHGAKCCGHLDSGPASQEREGDSSSQGRLACSFWDRAGLKHFLIFRMILPCTLFLGDFSTVFFCQENNRQLNFSLWKCCKVSCIRIILMIWRRREGKTKNTFSC